MTPITVPWNIWDENFYLYQPSEDDILSCLSAGAFCWNKFKEYFVLQFTTKVFRISLGNLSHLRPIYLTLEHWWLSLRLWSQSSCNQKWRHCQKTHCLHWGDLCHKLYPPFFNYLELNQHAVPIRISYIFLVIMNRSKNVSWENIWTISNLYVYTQRGYLKLKYVLCSIECKLP